MMASTTALSVEAPVVSPSEQGSVSKPQSKLWSRAEVLREVQDGERLLIILHNAVYDVREWTSQHPGGDEVILEYVGKDATSEFEALGHSKGAREMLKSLCVGGLVEEDVLEV
ncbi:Cyt-b5 [Symbiodinium sp. KB8]|nr:Cyt-b5 [Symbiodinium sp. KB8]